MKAKILKKIMSTICMIIACIVLILNLFEPADSLVTYAVLFVCYSIYFKEDNNVQ